MEIAPNPFPAFQTRFQAETPKSAFSILHDGHPATPYGNVLPPWRKNNLPGNRTSIKSHRGKAPTLSQSVDFQRSLFAPNLEWLSAGLGHQKR